MISFVLGPYWNICLLRESPQNTPYSISRVFLSGILLIFVMVIEWSFSSFTDTDSSDLGNTLLIAAGLTFSYVIYTYFILSLKQRSSRLVQTVTSLFNTSIIIHVLIAPLLFLAPYLSSMQSHSLPVLFLGIIYLLLSIGLSVWQFVINVHIYKCALNTTPMQSAFVALGLMAVNILTVSSLQ